MATPVVAPPSADLSLPQLADGPITAPPDLALHPLSWSAQTSGLPTTVMLEAVGGIGGDVWAGGGTPGTIIHSGDHGQSWAPQYSMGTGIEVRGLWAASGAEAFAAGTGGMILHTS